MKKVLIVLSLFVLASCGGGGSDESGWGGEWKLQAGAQRNECQCQPLSQPLTLTVTQQGNEITACDAVRCVGLFWFKGEAGADSVEGTSDLFSIDALCGSNWDTGKATLRISTQVSGGFEGSISVLGAKSNSAETCLTEYKGTATRD